jgi:hypothetical protein
MFLLESCLEGETRVRRLLAAPALAQGLVCLYVFFMLVLLPAGEAHEFIYFQF